VSEPYVNKDKRFAYRNLVILETLECVYQLFHTYLKYPISLELFSQASPYTSSQFTSAITLNSAL